MVPKIFLTAYVFMDRKNNIFFLLFDHIIRYSSTDYQTTNYGLGGLCETHMDPAGFVRGKMKMHKDEFDLRAKGIT